MRECFGICRKVYSVLETIGLDRIEEPLIMC